MRGPSEGLHEGPALGRGGRGKGATPQPMAGPRGRDRHAAPPTAVRRRRQGTRAPPPLPPPLPLRPKSRRRQTEETAAPHTPPEEAAAPGMPADGGPAAPRTAQTERPYQRPARGRRGREPGRGVPPPSPPPAALTRRRRTGPRLRPCGRPATPTSRVYPRGARRGQQKAGGRPTGRGGRGGGPPSPPPRTPPQLGSHRSGPPAPRTRGDPPPPPPRRDLDAGGGMRLDLLPRGSRPQGEPTPVCRSNARTRTVSGPRPT